MARQQEDLTWFRPIWRRLAIAIFLTVWLGWELLYTGDSFWAVIVGAALAYVAWKFFINFPKEFPQDTAAAPPVVESESTDTEAPDEQKPR